jgi:putative nucleotidyltransferase with HDIG domain
MAKSKIPTLPQIKKLMIKVATEHRIKKQANSTWRHSTVVWQLAKKIAGLAIKNGYQVDLNFLKAGAYCHDIGRMVTGSKGSKVLAPARNHFFEGQRIMKKAGYPKLARVCVCHALGGGLSKKFNKDNGFIARDFFSKTTEEKIIAYADARTYWKKETGPYIWTFMKAYNRFKKYPGAPKRLKKNHQFIKKITKGIII